MSLAEWSVGETLQILRQSALFEGYQREHPVEVGPAASRQVSSGEKPFWCWAPATLAGPVPGATRPLTARSSASIPTAGRCRTLTGAAPATTCPMCCPCATWCAWPSPRTDKTLHMLDAGTMSCMKQGTVLVVNSRGRIVDEDKMCQMLDSGHLRGRRARPALTPSPFLQIPPLWEAEKPHHLSPLQAA